MEIDGDRIHIYDNNYSWVLRPEEALDRWEGIHLHDGAQGGIGAPAITAVTSGSLQIAGTACAYCQIEVYENSDNDGEGETYLATTSSDEFGDFSLTVSRLSKPFLTATAMHAVSGTSEFSAPYEAWVSFFVYLPLVSRHP